VETPCETPRSEEAVGSATTAVGADAAVGTETGTPDRAAAVCPNTISRFTATAPGLRSPGRADGVPNVSADAGIGCGNPGCGDGMDAASLAREYGSLDADLRAATAGRGGISGVTSAAGEGTISAVGTRTDGVDDATLGDADTAEGTDGIDRESPRDSSVVGRTPFTLGR
jgi:hypothetical protein